MFAAMGPGSTTVKVRLIKEQPSGDSSPAPVPPVRKVKRTWDEELAKFDHNLHPQVDTAKDADDNQ
jgi:hypothetical protein